MIQNKSSRHCKHCKLEGDDLERLNNSALLALFQEIDSKTKRTDYFCKTCKGRAKAKLQRRKLNAKLAARKGKDSSNSSSLYSITSSDGRVTTYLRSQTTTDVLTKRREKARVDAKTSRNVARRTKGRPALVEVSNQSITEEEENVSTQDSAQSPIPMTNSMAPMPTHRVVRSQNVPLSNNIVQQLVAMPPEDRNATINLYKRQTAG